MQVQVPPVPPVPPVPRVRVRVRVPGVQPPALKVRPPQPQLVAARTLRPRPHEPLVPEVLLPELTAQEPRSQHPGRRTVGRAWRPTLAVSTFGT